MALWPSTRTEDPWVRDACYKRSGFILCMCPANERQCYNVTLFLIGWAHAQNGLWKIDGSGHGGVVVLFTWFCYQRIVKPGNKTSHTSMIWPRWVQYVGTCNRVMLWVLWQCQCRRKTFMVHQTFVWWALYILYKFAKLPIRHLGLAIGNVRRFSPTLQCDDTMYCVMLINTCAISNLIHAFLTRRSRGEMAAPL